MEMYAIAVKYDRRQEVTLPEALDRIRDIEGLQILDDGNDDVARIMASETALRTVVKRVGWGCHIESLIPHSPQSSPLL